MLKSKILFVLTGSIACYKAAGIISQLVQKDFEVQTAATQGALRFLGEATLEGLTGRPVFTDIFKSGQMMGHIDHAKWANGLVICPASAQSINGLASGTASEPLGSLFLAFDLSKPVFIAPAMNQQMWKSPSVKSSLRR